MRHGERKRADPVDWGNDTAFMHPGAFDRDNGRRLKHSLRSSSPAAKTIVKDYKVRPDLGR